VSGADPHHVHIVRQEWEEDNTKESPSQIPAHNKVTQTADQSPY